jgi:hypothetical protein
MCDDTINLYFDIFLPMTPKESYNLPQSWASFEVPEVLQPPKLISSSETYEVLLCCHFCE